MNLFDIDPKAVGVPMWLANLGSSTWMLIKIVIVVVVIKGVWTTPPNGVPLSAYRESTPLDEMVRGDVIEVSRKGKAELIWFDANDKVQVRYLEGKEKGIIDIVSPDVIAPVRNSGAVQFAGQ